MSVALSGMLVGVVACSGNGAPKTDTDVAAPEEVSVHSPAFSDGSAIPERFGCDGTGAVPPLRWDDVPGDAAAVALVVDDPDAPGGTFVHWIVLDLPPATARLDAGRLPDGAVQATNSAGEAAYAPPCPPSGTHHYRFTVYALSERTGLDDGVSADTALDAIRDRVVARGRLVGTFTRGG